MPLKELEATPDLRDDPSLRDFNDIPSLAKSYKEQKAFLGTSIRPPGPDASPEAKKEFYTKLQQHAPHLVPIVEGDAEAEKLVWQKLGRPTKPEEYEAEVPKELGLDIAPLRQMATLTGMTKGQFKQVVAEAIKASQKGQLDRGADADNLKKEWGAAYQQRLDEAATIAHKMGQPEVVIGALKAGRMPSGELKLWYNIAAAIGKEPGSNFGGDRHQNNGALTPTEVEARLREIQVHPGFTDRMHPEHDVLVRRQVDLLKQLPPK